VTITKPNYVALAAQAKAEKTSSVQNPHRAVPAAIAKRLAARAAARGLTRSVAPRSAAVATKKSAIKSSARVVDPNSYSIALFLVPQGVDTSNGDFNIYNYNVGDPIPFIPTYNETSSDGTMPDNATATITGNISGDYQWAHFEIYDSNSNLLTQGDSYAGFADPAGNIWNGAIEPDSVGPTNLSMVGFPATVTQLSPPNGLDDAVAEGSVAYYSFTPAAGATAYQYMINDDGDGCDALLVLYGANGQKYAGANYYTDIDDDNNGLLQADYASAKPPYLAVFGEYSSSGDVQYSVNAIPQYPADGRLISGTDDGSDWGSMVCFHLKAGMSYTVSSQSNDEIDMLDSSGGSLLWTDEVNGNIVLTPTAEEIIYLNIYGPTGTSYSISVTPSTPSAPTMLAVSQGNIHPSTTLFVKSSLCPGAASYTISRSDLSSPLATGLQPSTDPQTGLLDICYLDSGLSPSTTYTYTVTAVYPDGFSPALTSSPKSGTTAASDTTTTISVGIQ
jgi:hypothetical protein